MKTKLDALRRLLPCLHATAVTSPSPTTTPATAPIPAASKKRISASLREDLDEIKNPISENHQETASSVSSPTTPAAHFTAAAPPRYSRTIVIGTIFGNRRGGHVWFCIHQTRLSRKPSLLLELSIPTTTLIQEMQCGIVRIALESNGGESPELGRCHLHSVPLWTLFCNGRKLGFAVRRKANPQMKMMFKTMQSTTVGAGAIPGGGEQIMYMRANYEWVVGSPDSESFHLINPDDGTGQELSIFLIRS